MTWRFNRTSPEPPPDPIERALQGVVDSARVASSRHLAFLAVMAFVFMTVLGTNHGQLFVGDGDIALPLLGVKVGLQGFYLLTPWLIFFLHLNLLAQCRLVTDKTRYLQTLFSSLSPWERRDTLYRLPVFPLVQMLAGREIQTGGMRRVIALLFWLAVVFLPLVVLGSIQLRFLPYHGEAFTWNHRLALTFDALALFFMWRRIYPSASLTRYFSAEDRSRPRWLSFTLFLSSKGVRYLRQCFSLAPLFFSLVFSYGVATIPDGWLEEQLSEWKSYPNSRYQHSFFLSEWVEKVLGSLSYRNLSIGKKFGPFVGGAIDTTTRNLLLKGDPKEIAPILGSIPSLDLNGRNFKYAHLGGTSLVKINLREAQLQGADLSSAQLQGADLSSAQLQGADLSSAQLQGAVLWGAQLQGADLSRAQLQGAYLLEAQLQGAVLWEAQLQEAYLWEAQLQGAVLWETQLQGAYLSRAQLQGAVLWETQLQGADLSRAQLQGAYLSRAQLQGADLSRAQLQGADLSRAQLQGADLSRAQLQGSVLHEVNLNYADLREIKLGALPKEEREALLKAITPWVSRDELSGIQERLSAPRSGQLLPVDKPWDCLSEQLATCRHRPKKPDRYRQLLADQLLRLACPSSAIAKGIWKHRLDSFNPASNPARPLFAFKAEKKLEDRSCPGLSDLPEETKDDIRRVAAQHEN